MISMCIHTVVDVDADPNATTDSDQHMFGMLGGSLFGQIRALRVLRWCCCSDRKHLTARRSCLGVQQS